MVSVSSSGPNLKQLARQITSQAAAKKAQAVLALADAVDHGTLEIQDALEAAVTPTGERRAEQGGFAGRHKTALMVASISNNSHNPEYDGERTVMAMGWFPGNFEEYFIEQDLGLNGIPAAHAGFSGFDVANRIMVTHLVEWEQGDLQFNE
jgi:hypothetical protein